MKLLLVLSALLCLTVADNATKTNRITITTESQANLNKYLADIYAGIEYAFDTGSGSDGRMQALDYYLLYVAPSTMEDGLKFVCVEVNDGKSHLSLPAFGYFKVTHALLPYHVKVICANCKE